MNAIITASNLNSPDLATNCRRSSFFKIKSRSWSIESAEKKLDLPSRNEAPSKTTGNPSSSSPGIRTKRFLFKSTKTTKGTKIPKCDNKRTSQSKLRHNSCHDEIWKKRNQIEKPDKLNNRTTKTCEKCARMWFSRSISTEAKFECQCFVGEAFEDVPSLGQASTLERIESFRDNYPETKESNVFKETSV